MKDRQNYNDDYDDDYVMMIMRTTTMTAVEAVMMMTMTTTTAAEAVMMTMTTMIAAEAAMMMTMTTTTVAKTVMMTGITRRRSIKTAEEKIMKILMVVAGVVIAFDHVRVYGNAVRYLKVEKGKTTQRKTDSEMVKVPDVTGKTYEEAQKELNQI